jgi:hypothetical protein
MRIPNKQIQQKGLLGSLASGLGGAMKTASLGPSPAPPPQQQAPSPPPPPPPLPSSNYGQSVIPGQGDPHKPGFDPKSVPFHMADADGGGILGQLFRWRDASVEGSVEFFPRTLVVLDPSHPIKISKGIMDTSLERIRAKIAELETKLADLRIAERELLALEKFPVRKPKPKRKPEAGNQEEARHTIGAAIADVLGHHGALSAAEIADHIRATGRDINNRAVSFSLQALKKRGLVRSADGRWTLPKARSRRARS